MRKRAAVLLVLAGLTVLAVALAALLRLAPPARVLRMQVLGGTRLTTSETLIANACPDMTDARVSPDARRVACFVGNERGRSFSGWDWVTGGARVVVNGVAGKKFGAVAPSSLRFSPDGKRLSYVANRSEGSGRGDKQMAVVDGVEGQECELVRDFVWSPVGGRFAYAMQRDFSDLAFSVVVDGTRFGPYGTSGLVPVFSADGKRVAWVAERGKTRLLVLDGRKEGPGYEYTYGGDVSFSPDGNRIAYKVGTGLLVGHNSVVVQSIEAVERGEKADCVTGDMWGWVETLLFSPDSRRFAFWLHSDGVNHPVLDGVKQKKPKCEGNVPVGDLVFSPDSRRLAYVSGCPRSEFVVVDGVEAKRYDSIRSGLVFSSDSQRLAYAASRGNNKWIVVIGNTNQWLVVIGNTESSEYEQVRVAGVFSPDAKRTAYAASLTGGWVAVVDGVPGKQYEEILGGPLFSPDSRHIAYLAKRTGKWFVVVDGVESQEYDHYAGERNPLVFDGPNLVRAIMQRGDQVLRVEVRIG